MSNSPNNNLPYVPQDTLDPAAGLNDAIRVIDALLNARVENMTQNSPTSADAVDGQCFIVGGAPISEWAGHAHAIAQFVADGAFWNFYEAGVTAWLVLNKADGNLYKWNPTTPAWEVAAGIGEAPLDGSYYGRKDGTWSPMPDVSSVVLTVNNQSPDTSGNVDIATGSGDVQTVNGQGPDTSGNAEVNADQVPFFPDTASALASDNVGDALNELGARSSSGALPYLMVVDQKAQGTAGGASSAGVNTRVLNTVDANSIIGASISSNQLTLPAGTYRVVATAPCYKSFKSVLYLYNVTASANLIRGTSRYFSSTVDKDGLVNLSGQFTLPAIAVVELRQYINSAQATNGLGVEVNNAAVGAERYAQIELWKIS